MQTRSILLLQGHPDTGGGHLCQALAKSYAQGAAESGHCVSEIDIAALQLPLLESEDQWRNETPVDEVLEAQQAIQQADHLVLIYPLWLGTMPAVVKAFLEQVMRPGFALDESNPKGLPRKLLRGRSARVVVTMGMPAVLYRWYFGAHSLKSLERNVLSFCGIRPVRETLIGNNGGSAERRRQWLQKLRRMGAEGL